jgi:hypothetical protein
LKLLIEQLVFYFAFLIVFDNFKLHQLTWMKKHYPSSNKSFVSLLSLATFISLAIHAQKIKITPSISQKEPTTKVNSSINSIPKKCLILDSSYHDEWVSVGEKLNPNLILKLIIDSTGNLFGIWLHRRFDFSSSIVKWEDSLIIKKLVEGKWMDWYYGLPSQIDKSVHFEINTDDRSQLYLSCNKGLYKLSPNGWVHVFNGCCQNIPKIMSDGNLYSMKTEVRNIANGDSSFSTSLCRYKDGVLNDCVTYITTKQTNKNSDITFDVGRDGYYYCYMNGEDSDPVSIRKWNGNEWTVIGTMPSKIMGWNFDNNGLYVYASRKYSPVGNYLKRWDGKNWTDINLPSTYKGKKLEDLEYKIILDEAGIAYLSVETSALWDSYLFKNINNKWIEWANNRRHNFFPTSKEVYSYPRVFEEKETALYKSRQYWSVRKREVSDIPLQPDIVLPAAYSKVLSEYRILYVEGGKRCLQKKEGLGSYSDWCFGSFDSIMVVKTPPKCFLTSDPQNTRASYSLIEMRDYALQLISGMDILYINLTEEGVEYLQGFIKKYVPADPGKLCTYCDGMGVTADGTISSIQKVGKDWEPAKTFKVKTLGINGWRIETINEPGYYKSYEWKSESKKVSGSVCTKCEGLGKIGARPSKWVIVNYSKNNFTGSYSESWHMEAH